MNQLVGLAHSKTALLLIDAQKGFSSPYWGARNNPNAEANMNALLKAFRDGSKAVIHVQHLSKEEQSPLNPRGIGVEFIESLRPLGAEPVFQKSVNSAFIGTDLERYLKAEAIQSLVMVGFTTDHCVSTTARMAANLGFKVAIIADATVAFDRSVFGTHYPADLVHSVSLASLNDEFAVILLTEELLRSMR
jgi:nicotinamidase-related amidase